MHTFVRTDVLPGYFHGLVIIWWLILLLIDRAMLGGFAKYSLPHDDLAGISIDEPAYKHRSPYRKHLWGPVAYVAGIVLAMALHTSIDTLISHTQPALNTVTELKVAK
jgi:hypothetical protein